MNSHFGPPDPFRRERSLTENAQARCDAIQAEYRAQTNADQDSAPLPSPFAPKQGSAPLRKSIRRDPPPRPKALIPTDDMVSLRLAEEIDYVRRMLESMGDALTNDPALLARHSTSLQSVDIIGQILGHIAAVVRSSDPPGAVELIGMCELKARLKRTSIA